MNFFMKLSRLVIVTLPRRQYIFNGKWDVEMYGPTISYVETCEIGSLIGDRLDTPWCRDNSFEGEGKTRNEARFEKRVCPKTTVEECRKYIDGCDGHESCPYGHDIPLPI